MRVFLNEPPPRGQAITVDPSSLIKRGGMGSAFRRTPQEVLKIYHDYNPEQTTKLQAFMGLVRQLKQQGHHLPDGIIVPTSLAFSSSGQIAGFTMPYLDPRNQPMWQLVQPNFRKQFRITPAKVAEIFLPGIPTLNGLHSLSIKIGDHNYRNTFFTLEPTFSVIDSDSFAFGQFGSEGTDLFLDPALHGKDLSQPIFSNGNDWYSYAVMLFLCMTTVHPYGGFHRRTRKLLHRIEKGISVFRSDVIYPTDAVPLSQALTPPLKEVFQGYFEQGTRQPFPADVLADYIAAKSGFRPQVGITIPDPTITTGPTTTVMELLQIDGQIIYSTIIDEFFHCFADEDGYVVYYKVNISDSYLGIPPVTRVKLFAMQPGTRLGLIQDTDNHQLYAVVNPSYSEDLIIHAITSSGSQEIANVKTGTYLGTGNAMFRTSEKFIYFMVSNDIFTVNLKNGSLQKRSIRPFRMNQTWFASDPNSPDPKLVVFTNVFARQEYFLVEGTSAHPIQLPKLNKKEVLQDISVKFARKNVTIIRLTEESGQEYIRLSVINDRGKIVHTEPTIKRQDHFYQNIHGRITATTKNSTDLVLHPTPNGVTQQRLQENNLVEMPNTSMVNESSILHRFLLRQQRKSGMIAVNDSLVFRLG